MLKSLPITSSAYKILFKDLPINQGWIAEKNEVEKN